MEMSYLEGEVICHDDWLLFLRVTKTLSEWWCRVGEKTRSNVL